MIDDIDLVVHFLFDVKFYFYIQLLGRHYIILRQIIQKIFRGLICMSDPMENVHHTIEFQTLLNVLFVTPCVFHFMFV